VHPKRPERIGAFSCAADVRQPFVRDMALIQLPHIHSVLREVAARQGTTLEENFAVSFLDRNGIRRS
jgi:hypothetical protein